MNPDAWRAFLRRVAPPAVILLLGAAIYANSLRGPFQFDDALYIVDNSAIRVWGDWGAICAYYPTRALVFLSLALNYRLAGLEVFGYHVVNVLLHVSTALLVWWLVLQLLRPGPHVGPALATRRRELALFTALIFLCHPLQTEAVSYIWQRCTSLVALFYLLAIGLYLESRRLALAPGPRLPARLAYGAALAAALAAMFTKENAATLPLAMALCDFFRWGRHAQGRWPRLLPMLAMLAVVPLGVVLLKPETLRFLNQLGEDPASGWTYAVTQIRVWVTYLRLYLLPVHQNLDYDYPMYRTLLAAPVLASLALLATLAGLVASLRRRVPVIAFCGLWFVLTMAPESSVLNLHDVIFEHRLYLPLVGLALASVVAVVRWAGPRQVVAVRVLLACWIAALATTTVARNRVWASDLALWSDTIRKSPHKGRPYTSRGIALLRAERLDEAGRDFQLALALNPDDPNALCNLGVLHLKQERYADGIAALTRAIELAPWDKKPYYNRGNGKAAAGQLAEARSDFASAIARDPRYALALNNRGNVFRLQGDLEAAIADFSRALAADPRQYRPFRNRSRAYLQRGQLDAAAADCARAMALQPGTAELYALRAEIRAQQGDAAGSAADRARAETMRNQGP